MVAEHPISPLYSLLIELEPNSWSPSPLREKEEYPKFLYVRCHPTELLNTSSCIALRLSNERRLESHFFFSSKV